MSKKRFNKTSKCRFCRMGIGENPHIEAKRDKLGDNDKIRLNEN